MKDERKHCRGEGRREVKDERKHCRGEGGREGAREWIASYILMQVETSYYLITSLMGTVKILSSKVCTSIVPPVKACVHVGEYKDHN